MTHDVPPTESRAEPAPAPAEAGDGTVSQPVPDHEADADTLRTRLAEARERADDLLNQLRRERADFTNFRRRTEDERIQRANEATQALVLRLLPVLDDFERAIASAPAEARESAWGQGFLLIERNFRNVLAAEGLERTDPLGGEFDPREHEAVLHMPSQEAEPGTIVQVVRPGYRKGERVIRPAQVVVARAVDG